MRNKVLAEDVVPDSEDEREWDRAAGRKGGKASAMEVIEIFSSDEEEGAPPPTESRASTTSHLGDGHAANDNSNDRYNSKAPTRGSTVSKTSSLRQIEIIEITDSSDSSCELPDQLSKLARTPVKSKPNHKKSIFRPPTRQFAPLYADDDEFDPWDDQNDGAILTLNDPRSARKPIRRSPESRFHSRGSSPTKSSTSTLVIEKTGSDSDSDASNAAPVPPTPRRGPAASLNKSPVKTPRITKKAQAAAEQARREKYASEPFVELNRTVFNGGLPKETKLNWSKRLLTTAGKARWHRSRDGVDTTEIELATKILDCDERIRNTLSHEMCHLACWIINNDPKEGHGRAFKTWAARVTRKRPEIEISTRHNYEISYPYEWKCEQCSKIYGRYSKSIRPDECVCGACKVGKLIPLFTQRAPRTPKVSRNAISSPQGASPVTGQPP
ncbi:hypothetical protein BV22DRAFT_1116952 [Leucogyrophana mollusca]|uniref:Uncharacterized protein n=1 Tax=Leucogyrophana mollusca TaxID=85980 RepID=A0ACB8BTX4_9AGAM|nr:hypothetical protein BV22DRAFT_1116952 [Leucogyrophana mollusca]